MPQEIVRLYTRKMIKRWNNYSATAVSSTNGPT